MKHLGMDSLKELVVWSLSAEKPEIAALAPLILALWKENDEISRIVIESCIKDLSDDLICLVRKFDLSDRRAERISVGLTGSLFSKCSDFAEAFEARLKTMLSHVGVSVLRNTSLGSLKMLDAVKWKNLPDFVPSPNKEVAALADTEKELAQNILPVALGLSLTEKRNEKSMNLDRMHLDDAIELMVSEEQNIFGKMSEKKELLRILIERICGAFQNGGRLFYVGAGTSGRLGRYFCHNQSHTHTKLLVQ